MEERVPRRGPDAEGRMEMEPVRGRPLGLLGWLILVALDRVVGEEMEEEPEHPVGPRVDRGESTRLMERKAA